MPRKKQGHDFTFLKIITWPFKMLFKLASKIVEGLVKGIDWLIRKNSERPKKPSAKPSTPSVYVPFRVVENISGSMNGFENFLAKNPSTIGIILGARGTGKSAIGLKLLENMRELSRKKFYAMGFKDLPSWIAVVDRLDDIEPNSFVLIDEGGILFSARESFSDANKLLSELLLIARHKDLSVIFISQNSANLEINAIRQADYLMLKPSSLLQKDFERKKIKEIYEEAELYFRKYRNVKGLTYIYSDYFKGFVSNQLPSFWTTSISKSFRQK